MNVAFEEAMQTIFARAAELKAAKRHDQEMALFYETLDREKHERQQVNEKAEEAKALEEVLATTEQIAAFDARLDDLDATTVHCLMENGEALDSARDQLRRMMDNADVLPDGRRVFKTADGQRVFDEHGAEITRDTIDPESISNRRTIWEAIKSGHDVEAKLDAERHHLLEFQSKIDAARTRGDRGDMTKKEMDDLGADLKMNAPPTVREKLTMDKVHGRTTAPGPASQMSEPAPSKDDLVRIVRPAPAPM